MVFFRKAIDDSKPEIVFSHNGLTEGKTRCEIAMIYFFLSIVGFFFFCMSNK